MPTENPTVCYKVTNSKCQSVMARLLPKEYIIQYGLDKVTTASRANPIFCFETFEQAENFAILQRQRGAGRTYVYKALGFRPVRKKQIGDVDHFLQYLENKSKHRAQYEHATRPLYGTLFFEEIILVQRH